MSKTHQIELNEYTSTSSKQRNSESKTNMSDPHVVPPGDSDTSTTNI